MKQNEQNEVVENEKKSKLFYIYKKDKDYFKRKHSMKNIKIRTGANIQAVLQSTVNFPQAFTELAKNSLQNGATKCEMDILQLNDSAIIKIIDNGRGFDHVKDEETNMNDFEKYFTFGNSYDLNAGGSGPKLGAMGLGGKISNDKLSKSNSVKWQIHTKNKHGKCFVVDYNPPSDVEFLDDYSPSLREIPAEFSEIKTETGTEVRILNVNSEFLKSDYKKQVKHELLKFFAHLVVSYQKQKKMLEIVFLGEKLTFSVDLNGEYRGIITRAFEYTLDGEKKYSMLQLKLNEIKGRRIRRQKRNSMIKTIELISDVKISDFHLNNNEIIEKTLERLSKEENTEIDNSKFLGLIHNFIGYVECIDLSRVLDENGMPAKDLSHHGIRMDHPITIPFLEEAYYVIIKLAYHISLIGVRKTKRKKLNKNIIAYNVAKLIAKDFEDGLELFSDKKMLGINKAKSLDSAPQKTKDLLLEDLIGSSFPDIKEDGTFKIKEELDVSSNEIVVGNESDNEKSTEFDDIQDMKKVLQGAISTIEDISEDLDSDNENQPSKIIDDDLKPEKKPLPDGFRPQRTPFESITDLVKSVFGNSKKIKSEESKQSDDTDNVSVGETSSNSNQSVTNSVEKNESSVGESKKAPYTKVTLDVYSDILKSKTKLVQEIKSHEELIANGDVSEQTKIELEELKTEYKSVAEKLANIKLFYRIDSIKDSMVISEIQQYRDGFIIIINENNIRYRSIQGDVMALALHVAEAMIKEIIFIEQQKIDKTQLDSELSKFYEKHYEELKSLNLLSTQ